MPSDKIKLETSDKHILNVAFLVSLGTGILYIYGWVYWSNFFRYFGIDNEFIVLDLIKSISTIWLYLIPLFMVLIAVFDAYSNELNKTKERFNMFMLIFLSSLIFFTLLIDLYTYNYINNKYPNFFYLIIGIFVIIGVLEKPLVAHSNFLSKEVLIVKWFQNKKYVHLYIIIVILLLLFLCGFMGSFHGEIRTHSKDRIIIQTNDDWQSPKEAILITHMDSKYFLYNSSSGNSTPEIFIIEDVQVKKAILLNDNSKSNLYKDMLTHFNLI